MFTLKKKIPAGFLTGLIYIVLITFLFPVFSQATTPTDNRAKNSQIKQVLDTLPMAFELNKGQTDNHVRFLSRGLGHTLFLTSEEAVLTLFATNLSENNMADIGNFGSKKMTTQLQQKRKGVALRMHWQGANNKCEIIGENRLKRSSNYFRGKDQSKWCTHIANYSRVRYKEIYKGIDMLYYSAQEQFEYDFIVKPGADPNLIKVQFRGAKEITLDKDGNLVLETEAGELIHQKPLIHQEIDGKQIKISGCYKIDLKNNIGFRINSYDKTHALIIDPVIIFSTNIHGTGNGKDIAIDSSENIYITGDTWSTDFPVQNPAYSNLWGSTDAFILKLSADGQEILYATYVGGSSGMSGEIGNSIAVDSNGRAYITGNTTSNDFPTVNAIYQNLWGTQDAFVVKLSADGGDVIYSTYLGGSGWENGNAITVDNDGNAYVTGLTTSTDFPTVNAKYPNLWGSQDAFVFKLNSDGSEVKYSTYLGGSGSEKGYGIVIDMNKNAYVTGMTTSTDFPTVNAKYPNLWGSQDAFVFKLNSDGSEVKYSTYLGGSGSEDGFDIAVDSNENAYVTGRTTSTDFPAVHAIYPSLHGDQDAFVFKLNSDGSEVKYSTYLGGSGSGTGYGSGDSGNGIAVDSDGVAYVTGETSSSDFPTVNAIYPVINGNTDAFIFKLSADGSKVKFSSYFGGNLYDSGCGISVDDKGIVFITGGGWKVPAVNALYPATNGTAFIAKFDSEAKNDWGWVITVDGMNLGATFFSPWVDIATNYLNNAINDSTKPTRAQIERKNKIVEFPWSGNIGDTGFYVEQLYEKIKWLNSTNRPVIILSHSWGTVLSYIVLKKHSDIHVDKLITLGSPLNARHPLIASYTAAHLLLYGLGPIFKPDNLTEWHNYYTECDLIGGKISGLPARDNYRNKVKYGDVRTCHESYFKDKKSWKTILRDVCKK